MRTQAKFFGMTEMILVHPHLFLMMRCSDLLLLFFWCCCQFLLHLWICIIKGVFPCYYVPTIHTPAISLGEEALIYEYQVTWQSSSFSLVLFVFWEKSLSLGDPKEKKRREKKSVRLLQKIFWGKKKWPKIITYLYTKFQHVAKTL